MEGGLKIATMHFKISLWTQTISLQIKKTTALRVHAKPSAHSNHRLFISGLWTSVVTAVIISKERKICKKYIKIFF